MVNEQPPKEPCKHGDTVTTEKHGVWRCRDCGELQYDSPELRTSNPPLSTSDLGWLVVAYEQFDGYAPFKAETIAALRELHDIRRGEQVTSNPPDVLEFLRAFIAGGVNQDFKPWARDLYAKLYSAADETPAAPRDPNYCHICTPKGLGYCQCEISSCD